MVIENGRLRFGPGALVWARAAWVVMCLLGGTAGCRTVADHVGRADRAAETHIDEARVRAGLPEGPHRWGRAETELRDRLIARQSLPLPVSIPTPRMPDDGDDSETDLGQDPHRLTLEDALRVAAAGSREYQDAKDKVFRAALKLDTESEAFRTSFEGALSGAFEDQRGSDRRGLTGTAGAGFQRAFETGAVIASRLTLDVVKLLTLDRESAYGLAWDASATIPLLRGAGREVVRAGLTQAEEDLVYALWEFERFKRRHAVSIAQSYFRVLELRRQVRNYEENYRSLRAVASRSRELAQSGRLAEVQVSQAEQDVLRALDRRNRARSESDQAADQLKQALGLPVDARLEFDDTVLDELVPPPDTAPAAEELNAWVISALERRLDLAIALRRVEDADRAARVAANALETALGLKWTGAAGAGRNLASASEADARLRFGDGDYSVALETELPWSRVAQRNAFRDRLVEAAAARRALEARMDEVKLDIRSGWRRRDDARDSFSIQSAALELAQRRVDHTRMLQEAGRAEMRDLLEAEEAQLNARNGLISSMINYRIAEWSLWRDAERLQVTEEGWMNEPDETP
ncbi:MAG: TolC family protein [Kiritimatiellae bacterium]|nr:TolC family protein [Kiritimatiellia bacterium]